MTSDVYFRHFTANYIHKTLTVVKLINGLTARINVK